MKPMTRKVTRVGRWAVYIFEGDVSDYHAVKYPNAMKRTEADYRAMLAFGMMKMIKVPSSVDLSHYKNLLYVAGMGTEDLPDIPIAGTYVRECTEKSRLLCVSRASKPFAYRNEIRTSQFIVPKEGIFALGNGVVKVGGKCEITFLNEQLDDNYKIDEVIISAPVAIRALQKEIIITPQTLVYGITAYVTPETKKKSFIKNET